jgi:thioesterase domain-containing protein
MAAAYFRALRETHPDGPYLLGGWSMGGVVAFEMARQAQAAGDPAARLLLVDSTLAGDAAPDGGEEAAAREVGRMIRFARHLGVSLDDAVPYGDALRMDAGERLAHLLALARDAGAVPPDFPAARFAALWEVFRTNVAALAAYRPAGPVNAPALLVRAADQRHAGTPGPALGWAHWLTGGLRVRSVAGDHFSVVREPQVHALAAELAAGIHPLDVCA